jgi:hypothetical protein
VSDAGVARLARAAGVTFPHIRAAAQRTKKGLAQRTEGLAGIPLGSGTAVVLTGSWGRREVTRDSDDDFIVLFNGVAPPEPDALVQQVQASLGGGAPGDEGVFASAVSLADLLERIGRDEDTNSNLTRRMLLILESVPVAGGETHAIARRSLLAGYVNAQLKDYRPPRFLLNDLIRYWRTIAVDFESKMRARHGEGWGLRDAKLRLSRKALFAGGLLPVLECHALQAERMLDYLDGRMAMAPLDRLADAFLDRGALDAGVRALQAYDEFLGVLDDGDQRNELSRLTHEQRHDSVLFQRIGELGDEFEAGLLSLLFDDQDLGRLVREYLIF